MNRTAVVVVNDNVLGSRPVLSKAQGPRIELSQPAKTSRIFPREGKTTYPNLHSKPPLISSNKPNFSNGYTNSYGSSILGITTHAPVFSFLVDSK